ncbi:hypothetical protein AAVH_37749 [Aphelenchoides avenae]|nr:hypothetical protein AAVH_37749 [Aphelenchus avenae]
MHGLGFRHIQARWDRDNYIYINESDIESKKEPAFAVCKQCENSSDPLFATYNPNSTLQYSEWALK